MTFPEFMVAFSTGALLGMLITAPESFGDFFRHAWGQWVGIGKWVASKIWRRREWATGETHPNTGKVLPETVIPAENREAAKWLSLESGGRVIVRNATTSGWRIDRDAETELNDRIEKDLGGNDGK